MRSLMIVSAIGQENMIKEAVFSGASSFIMKPFGREKLLEVLNKISN